MEIVQGEGDAAHSKEREEKSDVHESEDLDAQRRAASAAERSASASEKQADKWYWPNVLLFLGLLVAAMQALLFVKQLRLIVDSSGDTKATAHAAQASADAALEAVKVAQRSHIAEHRAWVSISPTQVGPVSFEKDRVRVQVVLEVKVLGQFPAVQIFASAVPYQSRMFLADGAIVEELISFEKRVHGTADGIGLSLMSGENWVCTFTADADTHPKLESKMKEQLARGVPTENMQYCLSVACSVIYKSLASDDWCHRGHVLWLAKRDGKDFNPALGDVAAADIKTVVLPNNIIA